LLRRKQQHVAVDDRLRDVDQLMIDLVRRRAEPSRLFY
jgi:hypothetical protein